MKIILMDGNLQPSSFIVRLARGLSNSHQVWLLGFSGEMPKNRQGLHYAKCGSNNKLKLLWISLGWCISTLLKKEGFVKVPQYLTALFSLNFKELQQLNLNRAIRTIQPDIVHLQWPSLLPWMDPYWEDREFKIILSQRGYQTNVRPFVNAENRRLLQDLYPKIDGFHSVSKAISEVGDRICSYPGKIDRVVYTGFEFSTKIQYKELGSGKVLKLLSVGRPHWIKGYREAILACKLLKEKGVSFSYEIIGAHGNEELMYLIHEYGLQNLIHLRKRVPQEDVYSKMKESDLLILSSYREGLPNVVVEAICFGLPVLTTKCGGVEELLDEHSGFVVSSRSPIALASGVEKFINSSNSDLEARRLNALELVRKHHSFSTMVKGMENLYELV